MRLIVLFAVSLLLPPPAFAEIKSFDVEYRHADAVLEGYLVYDDAVKGERPGVLVVHEWKGLNDYAKRRATQLAGLGYVAFAADMYGKGVRAKDHEEAAQLSGIYRKDRPLMRARILAAFDVLKSRPEVDLQRIGAIGYCFGGTSVLELARSGANVKGVVSFHGGLSNPEPENTKNIRGKVLVLHGGADTFITPQEVDRFEREMQEAGVQYRLVRYPLAAHSFTVPEAGNDKTTGMAYDADADRESWEEMKRFFEQIFGGKS